MAEALKIAVRILAEEAREARGRPGRKPSGRVTWALIERLTIARRYAEADALTLLVTVVKRAKPRPSTMTEAERPDPKAMAWHYRRKARERAAEAVAEAARVALERAAWIKRGTASVMLRFNLPALKAAAFATLAGGVGVRAQDLGRLILAHFAQMAPGDALRELARLSPVMTREAVTA